MKNLSIIIPVYNEEENVIKLAEEIESAFQWTTYEWEVIWVDDCSDDNTNTNLKSFSLKHKNQKVIQMPKRGGQSTAVLYGISHAQYHLIATLDGDGQNSPYDLLTLKRLFEANDSILIQGVRVKRRDANSRLFSTGIANSFRRFILGDEFNDVGCAVRVFKKEIIYGLPAFKGWHRFLPVMLSFIYPDKVIEHPVCHRERKAGISKYGIMNRLWVGLFDLVGMYWFKKRMINIWKNSSTPSVLPDNVFLQEEYLYNGLRVKEQMNQ